MAPKKINIKERITDGEIDLSMSDLQDVPVKDIALFKKASSLDLSNNHIKALPVNFATSLTHITKLDLSKNQLSQLPDNFGELVKLKYLDLYQNQLQSLPISFNKLKNLRWLDLKDNPLEAAVSKVAGPCLDAQQCQSCAKDVVSFYTQVQEQLANDIENRQKERQKQLEAQQKKKMENKKNKKKDKAKQKKENGPIKENIPKSSNKKNKKNMNAVKQKSKPSSLLRSFLSSIILGAAVLFILTSVKYKHTHYVEETCVDLYYRGANALPPHLQVYATTVGSYMRYVHDKTGNVTLEIVKYVKNTDNFVNVYNTVAEHVKTTLQTIKEQYKNIVS